MRNLIGIVVVILSIGAGIYIGGYVMFFRGIIQIVQSITPIVIPVGIAIGLVKVLFASFVGWTIVTAGIFISENIMGG